MRQVPHQFTPRGNHFSGLHGCTRHVIRNPYLMYPKGCTDTQAEEHVPAQDLGMTHTFRVHHSNEKMTIYLCHMVDRRTLHLKADSLLAMRTPR